MPGVRQGLRMAGETGVDMKIPGTFVDQQRAQHDVLVVQLSCAECLVADCGHAVAAGSPVRMFLGAIGPIDARAEDRCGAGLRLSFAQPLDRQIVEHFTATA